MNDNTHNSHHVTTSFGFWRRYDVNDGLCSANVFCVAQDASGRLWLGTSNGLCLFDNVTWRSFTRQHGLVDNAIWALTCDAKDRIWAGAYQGLCQQADHGWTTFTTEEGLPDNRIRALLSRRDGTTLAGTYRGLSVYNGKRWTELPISAPNDQTRVINTLMEDRDGRLWIGGQHGLLEYAEGVRRQITDADGLPDNRIRALIQDNAGHLWAGSHGGLCRYDGKRWSAQALPVGENPQPMVNALIKDREGRLWAGTEQGIFLYEKEQWRLAASAGQELGSSIINTLFEDREGLIWAGTKNGLSRCDPDVRLVVDADGTLMQQTALALLEDSQEKIWIGSYDGGLYRNDDQTWSIWTKETGLAGNRIRALVEHPDGTVLAGASGGVSRFEAGNMVGRFHEKDTDGLRVRAMAFDRLRRLWVGTGHGVYLFDENEVIQFENEGFTGGPAQALALDTDQNVYVGTRNGVSRFDGQTWTTYTISDGLPHNNVLALAVDSSGTLWVGTQSGVCRYDGRMWATLTDVNMLSGQAITGIWPEEDGALWFSVHSAGVVRYDGRHTYRLTEEDGLTGNTVYALLHRRNGEGWFGTDRGVVCFKPAARIPPAVFIDAVTGDETYTDRVSLSLPTSTPSITLHFHGVSFRTPPGRMLHLFRLHGYDETWQTTQERQATYSGLPPARYRFEVIALDRDLVRSATSASVALYIHDPPDQSKRERLIEWVRMQTADMSSSRDMGSIITLIRRECLNQKLPLRRFGFFIMDERRRRLALTLTDEQGIPCGTLDISIDRFDLFNVLMAHWRRRLHYTTAWSPELQEVWQSLTRRYGRDDLNEALACSSTATLHFVPFVQGMLYAGTDTPLAPDDVRLVEAIAEAFAVTYSRYMDFLRTEAQNHALEAQNQALTEANARLQELDRLKTEFLSRISHNLLTPLTAIDRAAVNLVEGVGGTLSGQQQQTVARVQRNTDRLTMMIRELLDAARLEADRIDLDRKRVDLKQLAQTIVEELQTVAVTRGITLSLDADASRIFVNADPNRLYQIVLNLVENALKYTDEGGSVELSLCMDNSEARFSVKDNGMGIAAHEIEAIFNTFYQVENPSRQQRGFGLGLAIVKKLVELHGGRLGVDSAPGQGSVFWFTLPAESLF